MDQSAEQILMGRYASCDSKGHLNPKSDENYCNHCFRRLEYDCAIDPPKQRPDLERIRSEIIAYKQKQDFLRGLDALGESVGRL